MRNSSLRFRNSTKRLRHRRDRRLSQTRHRKLILENLEERVLLASIFRVDSTADTVDANPGDGLAKDADGNTTLRAAIMEANALGNVAEITLPAGTYTLTIGGPGEGRAVTGDLDIRVDTTILGDSADSTVIDGNSLDRVFDISADVVLRDLTVSGGWAPGPGQFGNGYGGGIQISRGQTVVLDRVAVSNNHGAFGTGGISNQGGLLTVTDSTVSGNSTDYAAGGIWVWNGGSAVIVNTTVSGNSADNGGGVQVSDQDSHATLLNSTVTGNTAKFGGGGVRVWGGGIATLNNTIVAGNTCVSGPDILNYQTSGVISSAGNNLVGNTSGATGLVPSDLKNVDPKLGVLADNGGPTLTHALLRGSPAIDAGNNDGAPGTDQRGITRPIDGDVDGTPTVDIGSFEFEPINEDPTLDSLTDLVIDEDADEQSVNLTGITAGGSEIQPLRVTASSNDMTVILDPTVYYVSDNSVATMTFQPLADQSGAATITVTVEDAGLDGNLNTSGDNATFSHTFDVTINAVNDAPHVAHLSNLTIQEDSDEIVIELADISAGGGEIQPLRVTATSSDTSVISEPAISYLMAPGDLLVSSQHGQNILHYDGTTGSLKSTFTASEINNPRGLIFGPNGNFFVANNAPSSSILEFDGRTGILVRVFAAGPEIFEANQLVFGPNGDLYVSNVPSGPPGSNHRIIRYDGTTGALKGVFATSGLWNPQDMVFLPNGNMIVANSLYNNVLEFDSSGTLLGEFIAAGSGGMTDPTGMVFGPNGNLFIANLALHQILEYDSSGSFLGVFASGTGLSKPRTLSFGLNGNLFVGCDDLDNVSEFDGSTGSYLRTFANAGGLDLPAGMAFVQSNPTGSLSFTPVLNQNGTATITVTVEDGGPDGDLGTSSDNATFSRTFEVTVNVVNDAPVNVVPGAVQQATENQPLAFTEYRGNGISIEDPDAGENDIEVTLTATYGTLSLVEGSGVTYSAGDGNDDATMTFIGKIADINTALSWAVFTPETDYTGNEASLTITTNDLGNTGAGGPLTDSDTIAVHVTAVPGFADSPDYFMRPSMLDLEFATDGKLVFSPTSGSDRISRVTQLEDGSIFAVGSADGSILLARFLPDGTPDASWGTNGYVTTSFNGPNEATDLVVETDGKIVVSGKTGACCSQDYAMFRYNADGTLDTTFSDDGILSFNANWNDVAYNIAVQPSGEYLLNGHAQGNTGIVQVSRDGQSLQTITMTDGFSGGHDYPNDTVIRDNGDIVFVGFAHGDSGFHYARANTSGTIETKVRVAMGSDAYVNGSYFYRDGKMLVVGRAAQNFSILRLNRDGQTDTSFGTDGKVILDPSNGKDDWASGVTVADDGKIVVTGKTHNGSNWDTVLVRLLEDGSLDPSFGDNGMHVVSLDQGDDGSGQTLILSDGKILTFGWAGSDTLITRWLGDSDQSGTMPPTLDPLADLQINEDAVGQVVNLTGISDGELNTQPLRVTATSSDTNLVLDPSVDYTAGNSTGSMAITTVANQSGAVTITATIEDGGLDKDLSTAGDNLTFSRTFEVTVNAVNDAPEIGTYIPTPTNIAVGDDGPGHIRLVDLNHDNFTDIVTLNGGSHSFSVLLGQAGGQYSTPQVYNVGTLVMGIAIGDVNNDDQPDIAVARYHANQVGVYLGNADGSFSHSGNFTASGGPFFLSAADFDGDNNADIAVATADSDDLGILISNGDGSFQDVVKIPVGDVPDLVIPADLNKDGKMDLAVEIRGGNRVAILVGKGDGTFEDPVHYYTGDSPRGLTLGDFNNDGNADLATANYLSSNIGIALGNGDGTFNTAVNYVANARAESIVAVDYNNDGNQDLFVTQDNTEALFFRGDGQGVFELEHTFPVPSPSRFMVVGDVNGDAKDDMLLATAGDYIQLFLNHSLEIMEDAPQQTITLTGINAGPNENQPLKLTATSSDTTLIPNPTVTYTSPDSTGTLKFMPITDQIGTATITVTVEDGGLDGDLNTSGDNATFSQTFDVEVRIEFPWNNPRNVLDVNDDGFVSPIDAFIVISDLNVSGARELPVPPVPPVTPPPYLDPSGDNSISPIDAFMIVSFLSGSGSGEGEQFGAVNRPDTVIDFTHPHQWNNDWAQRLDTHSAHKVGLWWSDTDVPYKDQPIGFAERDGRDIQRARIMAGTSSWRESAWEDLLDEIAEDVSQLDNDDLGAI